MKIERTVSLSNKEISEIQSLYEECCTAEGLRLSFPCDEFSSVYLLYEETLSAVLGLILPLNPESDEPAECFAMTRPCRRQNGFFSALLDAAEEEFEDYDLLFTVDHTSQGALCALESLEAELESEEYLMEYDLNSLTESCFPRCLILRETQEEPDTCLCEFFPRDASVSGRTFSGKAERSGVVEPSGHMKPSGYMNLSAPAAFCRTKNFGSRACFYDFWVQESFRGQGLGKEALLLVLDSLRKKQCSGVFLHVSGDNLPAVSLYKKTGFHISEILSCYLY